MDVDIKIGSLAARPRFFLTRPQKVSMDITSVVHRVKKKCLGVLLTHLLKDLHAQYLYGDYSSC